MKRLKTMAVALAAAMSFMVSAAAETIDVAYVNTATNAVRVVGNVKNASKTVVHELYNGDMEDIGSWNQYGSEGVALARVADATDETGTNKCLAVTGRTSHNHGTQLQIAEYLNQHGWGTYRLSMKLRADVEEGGSPGGFAVTVMTDGSPSKASYTVYPSSIGSVWKEYSVDIEITSFGNDNEGNPITTCSDFFAVSGGRGTLIIRGVASSGTRNFYVDDVKLAYVENISAVKGSDPLDCSVTVKNGDSVIKEAAFVSDADGGYDFSVPIEKQADYSNITVNVKCNESRVDETATANMRNGRRGVSLHNEGGKLRVGVYPYDYVDANGLESAAFVAALYDGSGNMLGVDVCETAFDGSNEMRSLYLPEDAAGETVRVFCWSGLDRLVPLEEISVRDAGKAEHTVYIIGDSIAYTYGEYDSNNNPTYPKQGWGTYLNEFFDSRLTFMNCSGGGLSTKSYIAPTPVNNWGINREFGTWEKIQAALKPGDFVIMALGVNDTSGDDDNPDSKGTSESVYAENIKTFAQGAKEAGAYIIFATMTLYGGGNNTASFDNPSTEKYRARARVMMRAADECGAEYIDLGRFQMDYYNTLAAKLGGDTEAYNTVRSYFHNGADTLHYNMNGAYRLAQFIAYLTSMSGSELSKYADEITIDYELTDFFGLNGAQDV